MRPPDIHRLRHAVELAEQLQEVLETLHEVNELVLVRHDVELINLRRRIARVLEREERARINAIMATPWSERNHAKS